jgi:CheY-like chemotaxis protein
MQDVGDTMLEIESGSVYFGDKTVRNIAEFLPRDTKSTDSQPARPRILIVDDERLIADTCAEILEGAGFDTRTAYNGWSGLDAMAKFKPDYLLTDVLMPDMNGVELAISVKKMFPATRIVLFSGQAGILEILHSGRERGYEFELLAKPIHPSKLIEALKTQPD